MKGVYFWGGILLSFFITAFGLPAWFYLLSPLAASLGYALFWKSLKETTKKSSRFFFSWGWFAAVQAVSLSWMTSTQYHGYLILLVYFFVLLALGAQFGLLTLLIPTKEKLSLFRAAFIASCGVILEWSRLFVLTGFSWNPIGIALSFHELPLQFASLFGVYGLSFWVLFSNLLGYRVFALFSSCRKIPWKACGIWIFCLLIPYAFGFFQQKFYEKSFEQSPKLSCLLVQTALFPEQKDPFSPSAQSISSEMQWRRILELIQQEVKDPIDLIVLPEGALPFCAFYPIYSAERMTALWKDVWYKGIEKLPRQGNGNHREISFHEKNQKSRENRVSNAFCIQSLADYLHTSVLVGMDDQDLQGNIYNAAFFFSPHSSEVARYEKQILVPIGEYIPFAWCRRFAEKFGIFGSFTPGKKTKIFQGKVPMSVSICYEETYGQLIRKGRKKGALLFVNISNDAWFPSSKLALQHFLHGRIRAVENGVPLLRSCNTGITGGVDCFGRKVKLFEKEPQRNFSFGKSSWVHYPKALEKEPKALSFLLPLFTHPTLYTLWGDGGILTLSCINIFLFLGAQIFQRNWRGKKLP